jgi:dihydrofolate reductase
MATVIGELTMSLDGFVADPNDEVGPLFDWYGNGDVEVPTAMPDRFTFKTSEASARYLREAMDAIGAIVAGRRLYEVGGWGEMGGHPFGVPVFVLTHAEPADPPGDPFTFVTDGLESAIAQASAVAGDGFVGVGGPNVIQQCLNAGLLDEVRINLVPVLFGQGIPYFGSLARSPLMLEDPEVIEGTRVTHLVYRVRRD